MDATFIKNLQAQLAEAEKDLEVYRRGEEPLVTRRDAIKGLLDQYELTLPYLKVEIPRPEQLNLGDDRRGGLNSISRITTRMIAPRLSELRTESPPFSGSRKDAVLYILRQANFGMRSGAIAKAILVRKLIPDATETAVAKAVDRCLVELREARQVFIYPRNDGGKRNNYYGLAEWFENGHPKQQYALPAAHGS